MSILDIRLVILIEPASTLSCLFVAKSRVVCTSKLHTFSIMGYLANKIWLFFGFLLLWLLNIFLMWKGSKYICWFLIKTTSLVFHPLA